MKRVPFWYFSGVKSFKCEAYDLGGIARGIDIKATDEQETGIAFDATLESTGVNDVNEENPKHLGGYITQLGKRYKLIEKRMEKDAKPTLNMSAFQAKLIEGKLTKDEIEQAAKKEGNLYKFVFNETFKSKGDVSNQEIFTPFKTLRERTDHETTARDYDFKPFINQVKQGNTELVNNILSNLKPEERTKLLNQTVIDIDKKSKRVSDIFKDNGGKINKMDMATAACAGTNVKAFNNTNTEIPKELKLDTANLKIDANYTAYVRLELVNIEGKDYSTIEKRLEYCKDCNESGVAKSILEKVKQNENITETQKLTLFAKFGNPKDIQAQLPTDNTEKTKMLLDGKIYAELKEAGIEEPILAEVLKGCNPEQKMVIYVSADRVRLKMPLQR